MFCVSTIASLFRLCTVESDKTHPPKMYRTVKCRTNWTACFQTPSLWYFVRVVVFIAASSSAHITGYDILICREGPCRKNKKGPGYGTTSVVLMMFIPRSRNRLLWTIQRPGGALIYETTFFFCVRPCRRGFTRVAAMASKSNSENFPHTGHFMDDFPWVPW